MTVPATLAVVLLVAAAAALSVPAGARWGQASASSGARPTPALTSLVLVTTVLVLWSSLSTRTFVLVLQLCAVALGVGRLVRRRRATRASEARAEQVLAVCDALASDLAAGQPPLVSLRRAADEWPELGPVAVAGEMGADVPAALQELSARPGARQLRVLAATWQVAHDTGSGLARAIEQAAAAIREDRRTARLVRAELAAAHATARMLAVLPLGVLLLGSGVGGDPIGFLVGTTAGLTCLGIGLGLSFAGLLWLERIADRVLRR